MITDERLQWLAENYGNSEPGQIARELLEARELIDRLEGEIQGLEYLII